MPAAPAGLPQSPDYAPLPRAELGAEVLGMGAQARGSEGAEGVHVDDAPELLAKDVADFFRPFRGEF